MAKFKKISLADAIGQNDADLHNSNVANLASAVNTIDAELTRLLALKEEIRVFASKEVNLQNTTEVDRLFKAAGRSNTRW